MKQILNIVLFGIFFCILRKIRINIFIKGKFMTEKLSDKLLNDVQFQRIKAVIETAAKRGLWVSQIGHYLNDNNIKTRYGLLWNSAAVSVFIAKYTDIKLSKISLKAERAVKRSEIIKHLKKLAKNTYSNPELLAILHETNFKTLHNNNWSIEYLTYYTRNYKIKFKD